MTSNEFKKTILDIILASSWHGFPSVFRTSRKLNKLIWIICLIVSTSYCVSFVIKIVNNYYQYDVVTKIDLIHESPIPFVTITFCNTKPQFVKYNLSETIIYCRYGSNFDRCNLSEFKWVYIPLYGYCFMFNSGKNNLNQTIPIKYSTMHGFFYGLTLQLYAGDKDYSQNAPSSYGFRIFINNQTSMIDPNLGIGIPIGFESRISLRREFTQKMEIPYSSCRADLGSLDAFDSQIYKEIITSNNVYSQKDCFSYLALKEVAEKCNCKSNSLNDLLEACTIKDLNCLYFYYSSFYTKNKYDYLSNQCPLECLTIRYTVETSTTDINYSDIKCTILNNSVISSKFNDSKLMYDNLKKEVLQVNVYYDDLAYIMISETPKTESFDLVSNIGGLLGLFIGASFLSFVELLEILFEVLFYLSERMKTNKKIITK